MKIKSTLISMLCASTALLIISSNSYAGFYNFTMHSRANCAGFNESVSWHFLNSNDLYTISQHASTKPENWWRCDLRTGWQNTWRSAAYHYAEGYQGGEWTTVGFHWGKGYDKMSDVLLTTTFAIDCNIYDGWWDK